jgi:hypothetical protein
MLPTYDIRSEKCETVTGVDQMRFRLSLLHRSFAKLRVGMKRLPLRTGSVKCGREHWNDRISRKSLIGQGQWVSGADLKN